MNEAIRQTGSFRNVLRASSLSLLRFSSSLVGIGSVSAAVYSVGRRFQELGKLADVSDMLNIDTKALIGFQLGAEEAGVSAEELQTSIRRLLKTIGDAAAKGEGLVGLDARTLLGLPTEEIVLRIADAISRIPTVAQRASAAAKLFGREGSKLTPLFLGGRKELEGFIKQAEALGITFSRFDVGKVDAAGDAFHRLAEAVRGVAGAIAIELAPTVDALSKMLTKGLVEQVGVLTRRLEVTDKTSTDIDIPGPFAPSGPTPTLGATSPTMHAINALYERFRRDKFVGPPSELAPKAESEFERSVREGIERNRARMQGLIGDTDEGAIRARIGGGLRTAKELGIVEGAQRGPAGGAAGKMAEKQTTLLERIAVTLGRIEKKNVGMAA